MNPENIVKLFARSFLETASRPNPGRKFPHWLLSMVSPFPTPLCFLLSIMILYSMPCPICGYIVIDLDAMQLLALSSFIQLLTASALCVLGCGVHLLH
jgi:hypothetical protein